ncbi:MAG: 2-C-methyl-D-erythritol 4-phosphate cytidylyltransferase [Chitinophagales bacterium]
MKKYAIIVGGGKGSRMGHSTPKQFLLLEGKPVLSHAIASFLKAFDGIEIILVLPSGWLDKGHSIMQDFASKWSYQVCQGGDTRFHSVKAGLKCIKEPSIVFIHDAVRCLVTPKLIQRCYDTALREGSAIPVIDSKDSVRLLDGETSTVIDRSRVKLVQTPQTFRSEMILAAFQATYHEKFTDEATIVEAMGVSVSLIEGEEQNIKITTPIDLLIAAQWLTAHNRQE